MLATRLIAATIFAAGLSACTALPGLAPPSTRTPSPTSTPTATNTPAFDPAATHTPTPPGCLTEPGSLTEHALENGKPAQEMLIYLPPCYEWDREQRFPVLYLLHGQTYKADQWVNLGATLVADRLIQRGESTPFIMVFPDDRYWNLPPGETFGDRLINEIIPYVDRTFRTKADREHRALGGLSRGGGWSIRYALTRYDLFGMIGLHSPVIFNDDAAIMERLIPAVPEEEWPRLWLDAGDRDGDLGPITRFEYLLTIYEVPHEWHIYSGDHTNTYWQAHLVEYLRWYAEGFARLDAGPREATPMP